MLVTCLNPCQRKKEMLNLPTFHLLLLESPLAISSTCTKNELRNKHPSLLVSSCLCCPLPCCPAAPSLPTSLPSSGHLLIALGTTYANRSPPRLLHAFPWLEEGGVRKNGSLPEQSLFSQTPLPISFCGDFFFLLGFSIISCWWSAFYIYSHKIILVLVVTVFPEKIYTLAPSTGLGIRARSCLVLAGCGGTHL